MLERDTIFVQINELSQLLGCECTGKIYCESPSSTFSDSPDFAALFGSNAPNLQRCLESAWRLQAERVQRLDANHVAFAIPLDSNDFLPWFGVGILQSNCLLSAERLVVAAGRSARMRIDLLRQQDAMQSASHHMSQVMREQAWLRDLASHTRLEQSRLGIDNIGQTIFEPLRRVIRAEAVGLLVESSEHSDHRQLQSQCFGNSSWTSADLAGLLKNVTVPLPHQVSSYSNLSVKLPNGIVRSAVVASLDSTGQSKFLVAINHFEEGTLAIQPFFGAHQIGLLHEAALYLASHTSNLRTLMESEQLVVGTLQAMSQAIEARDPYTRGHSDRVARMAYEIAGLMGLPNSTQQEILLTGVLHDIGKIGVPDAVLQKPGKLTEEERLIIEKHPEIGHGILEKLDKLRFTLPGVLYHHERWDGRGYPHHLSGTNIPLNARILAVADSFDAMTSSRPYRVGMRLDKTRALMMEGAGSQWDPEIIPLFWNWIDQQRKHNAEDLALAVDLQSDVRGSMLQAVSCIQQAV